MGLKLLQLMILQLMTFLLCFIRQIILEKLQITELLNRGTAKKNNDYQTI